MSYVVTPSPPAEALWSPLCSLNSISTTIMVPTNLSFCHNLTPSTTVTAAPYTSLRDLLPPAIVNSPRPMSPAAYRRLYYGPEIAIRNQLVKRAAWAYLKPMSNLTETVDKGFFGRFSMNVALTAFAGFVDRAILLPLTRAFKWLFCSI